MHMRGDSKTMNSLANYGPDVTQVVREYLRNRTNLAEGCGVYRWNVIVDPGIGFAKNSAHNVTLLASLANLTDISGGLQGGYPVLVGASRKRFIGTLIDEPDSASIRRAWGTAGACATAVLGGAAILRVHDVAEVRDCILVVDAVRSAQTAQRASH